MERRILSLVPGLFIPAGSLAYPATVKSPLVITPHGPPVLLK